MSVNKNTSNQGNIQNKQGQHDDQLIKEVESYRNKSGKSWNLLGQQIGISSSIISQWRRKKYSGDIQTIQDTIRKYLRVESQKSAAPEVELEYVPIENNKRMSTILETALTDGIIAAIIGDTGTSKTTTLKHFIEENNVIYIHANRTYRWPVEYLRRIHTHKIVGRDGLGTMNKMAIDIIHELTGKNMVIIVDQADYLNLGMIDVFRTINEEAGVGVVFCGLPSFLDKLRGNQPEVRQLRDRIKARIYLQPFSRSECKRILDVNFPGLNGYADKFYELSRGSLRVLSSLVYNVKKMIQFKNSEINDGTIESAAAMLERRSIFGEGRQTKGHRRPLLRDSITEKQTREIEE